MVMSSALRWYLRDEGRGSDFDVLDGIVGALGFVGVPVVGALIASRLPANAYGWVWCAAGLAYALFDVGDPLVQAAGWPGWLAWVWSSSCFVVLLGLLIL